MDKEELKLFLPDYLQEKGYKFNREGFINCINPDHEDKHPSMSFDKKSNILHCFSCGKTYDIFSLAMQEEKLSFKDALAFLNHKYGGEELPKGFNKGNLSKIPNLEESIRSLDNVNAIQYLKEERGFLNSEKVCSIARVKSDDNYIIFPHYHFISTGTESETYTITDYQARVFNAKDKKNRYRRSGKTSIYEPINIFHFTYNDPINIVICEGEIDSLSILDLKLDSKEELKNLYSVALSGASNTPLLERKLQSIPEERRKDYHFLIALDDDKSGIEQTKQIEEILESLSFPYTTAIDLLKKDDKNRYHDINDHLQQSRETLKDALIKWMREFLSLESGEKPLKDKLRDEYFIKNTAKTHLNALLSDFANKSDKLSINTNFERLNALFYGMDKGVITLGALSSLGKTTLYLQLADQLASQQDRDIIYFSLEQSGKELVSKSLSRLTFLNAKKQSCPTTKAKYSNSILATRLDENSRYSKDTEEQLLLSESINQYEIIANHLFIFEPRGDKLQLSIEDIENQIKEHISATGKAPIIFIDYLQIIAPKDIHYSDKQAIDINISTLRKIASIYDTLIFAISSVSRANYYTPIDMNSFKESGAIEYGSDILLGINFTAIEEEDIQKKISQEKTQDIKQLIKREKDKSPRKVFIEVLKNRNGKSGERYYFDYFPEFNTFVELDQSGEGHYSLLFKMLDDINNSLDDNLPF